MSNLAVIKASKRSRTPPNPNLKVLNPVILQLLEYYLTSKNDRPITDLFPYDIRNKSHSRLADGLKEYKMLLIATQEAMQSYQNGDLSDLDALVGENACQIRAIFLWTITEVDLINSKYILQKVNTLIEKIDLFIQKPPLTKENIKLDSFIKETNLILTVNHLELFIICSYILTKVRILLPPDPLRKIVRNEKTETKKIKEISDVGSSFARDVVKQIRKILSEISVTFIQDIANLLSIPESIIDMVSEKYCIIHNKFGELQCLPCFWYTFILNQYSIMNEIPIVFIISQINSDDPQQVIKKSLFCFQVVNQHYQEIPLEFLSEDQAVLVIHGSYCRTSLNLPQSDSWYKEFQNYNPIDLILAYAAAHRQYPDESKDFLVQERNCELLKYYQARAREWGCSLENPSLFFLVHAYCDKINNLSSY